ncbi:hypothetical protein DSO57_1029017 [Entomophthora muscae]|uniref:Uncharacterized protein n=1 Tax=Entomophthora muscae TaxID=34485 RepID=A0ACC2UL64_9FUNG|nr:hypothetical protein DSO57_1029017 [Entomophthora muscae]
MKKCLPFIFKVYSSTLTFLLVPKAFLEFLITFTGHRAKPAVTPKERVLNPLIFLENAGLFGEVCSFHSGISFGNDLDYLPRSLGSYFLFPPLHRGQPRQSLAMVLGYTWSSQDLFITSEILVKSLTCDDLEVTPFEPVPLTSQRIDPSEPHPSVEAKPTVPEEEKLPLEHAPKRTPWFLGGVFLMGLDSYFPCLSSASLLWMPLQVAIPVLHWMVSWWILPP